MLGVILSVLAASEARAAATFNSAGPAGSNTVGQGYNNAGASIAAPETAGASYGTGVACHGLDCIVAGPTSQGYVLHQDHDGLSNFGQHRGPLWYSGTSTKTGGGPERCGQSVAIFGHLAVVGCPCEEGADACPDNDWNNAGRALVFGRNNGGTGHWGHITGLVGAEALAQSIAVNDSPRCGWSVAIWGNIIAVGCFLERTDGNVPGSVANALGESFLPGGGNYRDDNGAVYLFDAGAGYTQIKRLIPEDRLYIGGTGPNVIDVEFGYSVALDFCDPALNADCPAVGITKGIGLVIGARRWPGAPLSAPRPTINGVVAQGNEGAMYVYIQDQGGADNWGLHPETVDNGYPFTTFTNRDTTGNPFCGQSVAISYPATTAGANQGWRFAMGCPGKNAQGALGVETTHGAVIVWRDTNPSPTTSVDYVELYHPAPATGQGYGTSIDFLHGTSGTLVLGITGANTANFFCFTEATALDHSYAPATCSACPSCSSVDGSHGNFIAGNRDVGTTSAPQVYVQDCICGNGFTDFDQFCTGAREQCDDGSNYDSTDGCTDACGIVNCLDGRQIYECVDDGTTSDLVADHPGPHSGQMLEFKYLVQKPTGPLSQSTTNIGDVVGKTGEGNMPLQCNNNDGDTGCMSLNRCRQKEESFIDPTWGLIQLGYCTHVNQATNPFQVGCAQAKADGATDASNCIVGATATEFQQSKVRSQAMATGGLSALPSTLRTRSVTARIPLGFIAGDPHFISFSGGKYEVSGIPEHMYNIISDKNVQFNGKFVAGSSNSTWIGEAGFLYNGHTIDWAAADEHILFDGQKLVAKTQKAGKHCLDEECKYYLNFWKGHHPAPPRLDVVLPGYQVHLTRKHAPRVLYWNRRNYWNSIKGTGVHHYGNRPFYFDHQVMRIQDSESVAATHPHGLLGQTARFTAPVEHHTDSLGRPARNGEGVIEGNVHDYEVSTIFGTDFKFNQFQQ